MSERKSKPNILITGTPGVGKSTLAKKLSDELKYAWLDISKIAIERNFTEEYDKELECPILDEDKVLDYLEALIIKGGNIVDYHGVDFFPLRFFDVIFVVRCDNTILYDRLSERKYNESKIKTNIECEIFGTILEEAQNSYDVDIVHEVKGETDADLKENIKNITKWVKSRIEDNK